MHCWTAPEWNMSNLINMPYIKEWFDGESVALRLGKLLVAHLFEAKTRRKRRKNMWIKQVVLLFFFHAFANQNFCSKGWNNVHKGLAGGLITLAVSSCSDIALPVCCLGFVKGLRFSSCCVFVSFTVKFYEIWPYLKSPWSYEILSSLCLNFSFSQASVL